MLVVVIGNGSDAPWSLKGWKITYKRVGATTYGWYLTDPNGGTHKDSADINQGFHIQYNVSSLEDLVESILRHGRSERAVEKYLLRNGPEETLTI